MRTLVSRSPRKGLPVLSEAELAEHGEFLGAKPLHPARTGDYLAYRDTALNAEVPYTEYWVPNHHGVE